jgi:hypothetical protein
MTASSNRKDASESVQDTVRDVVESITATDLPTTAEVLKELRRAFPDMPLAQRVAALSEIAKY